MPLQRICSTQCLASLALLVLMLGLPRALVMCSGGGHLHVDFAHAAGSCCGHAHGHAHAKSTPGSRGGAPEAQERCDHTEFAFELAPPPARAKAPAAPPPALLVAWQLPVCPSARESRSDAQPCATGPPRPAELLSLRATTLLLL